MAEEVVSNVRCKMSANIPKKNPNNHHCFALAKT